MPPYNVVEQATRVAARRHSLLNLLSPWREGLRPALLAAIRHLKR